MAKLTEMVQELARMQAVSLLAQQQPPVVPAVVPVVQPPQVSAAASPSDTFMSKGEAVLAKLSKKDVAEQKVPADLLAKLRAEGAKFGKHIRALGRSKTHLEKIQTRQTTLKSGSVPPGLKSWAPRDECQIWKLPLGTLSTSIPYNLPAETSLEDAKVRLLMEHHVLNTLIDIKFEEERVKELTLSCSLDSFLDRCAVVAGPWLDTMSKTTSGISAPPGLFLDLMEPVQLEAAKIYRLQVAAAARHLKGETDAADQKSKVQNEALQEAAKLKPDEVLARAFAAYVRKGGSPTKSGSPSVDFVKMLDVQIKPPVLADVDQKQKNGGSPGAARGSKQMPKHQQTKGSSSAPAAGRGKGKGKGSPSGRGAGAKGSGKGPGGGKDSSKGKGKSGQPKGPSAGNQKKAGSGGNANGSGRGGKSSGRGGRKANRQ